MIYTIGDKEIYDNLKLPCKKLGKKDYLESCNGPYQGGSVFKTYQEAKNYLISYPSKYVYDVYGVEAEWNDTENNTNHPYNNLLVDSNIVFLDEEGNRK